MQAAEDLKTKIIQSNKFDNNDDSQQSSGRNKYSTSNTNSNNTTAMMDTEMNDMMQLVKNQRDELLKQEIKEIQKNSYRLEKEELQQYEKTKKSILSAFHQEENELLNKIKKTKNDIAEYMIEKENMLISLNKIKVQLDEQENKNLIQTKEMESLRIEYKKIIHDKNEIEEECYKLESIKQKSENDRKMNRQQYKLDLIQQINNEKKNFDKKLDELQNNHKIHLEDLDQQVKTHLSKQESESTLLLEDIDASKIKIEKLKGLLTQSHESNRTDDYAYGDSEISAAGGSKSVRNSKTMTTSNISTPSRVNIKKNQTISNMKSNK